MRVEKNKIDRIDKMEAKKFEVVGYHKFLKKYIKNREHPICFIEGEDEKYYYLRVKLRCDNKEPVFIRCGNKEGVLNTFGQINGKYQFNNLSLFYFVDVDFDPRMNNPLIYETLYHSIENLYTSVEVVEKIFRNEFMLNDDDEDFVTALSLYIERQLEFHQAVLMLNAWISCQQDLRNSGVMGSKLKLKDKKLSDFVTINLDEVVAKYDISSFDSMFPEASKIENDVLARKIVEFEKQNLQQIFRGKFEVEFLKKFLDLVKEDLGKETPIYFKARKKVSINFQDVISQFANYADTSDCLFNYINRRWDQAYQHAQ
ncbi:DUF4435 domain-containing protein [Paenibacillus lautus]|nr:DUF4435 domain-containing protein [Paenibacillus lautus]